MLDLPHEPNPEPRTLAAFGLGVELRVMPASSFLGNWSETSYFPWQALSKVDKLKTPARAPNECAGLCV
jgi:hypothetical protein